MIGYSPERVTALGGFYPTTKPSGQVVRAMSLMSGLVSCLDDFVQAAWEEPHSKGSDYVPR
jgi:hypothetical protein